MCSKRVIITCAIIALFILITLLYMNHRPIEHFNPIDSESLKNKITDFIKTLDVPGAIVSVKSKVYPSFLINYGYSDVIRKIPVSIDDRFRIGSITKTFTGFVFLQLVQDGLIDLDAPVSKYLDGIPNGNNITIRQIGNMRSGIFNYSEDAEFDKSIEQNPLRNCLPAELLAVGLSHPADFPPGSKFKYSNTNTVILGLIIERITGSSIGDEIKRRILDPLGMKDTKFETGTALDAPYIHGYELRDLDTQHSSPVNVSVNKLLVDVTHNNVSWTWAAGAMSSKLHDLERYAELAFGQNVLLDAKTTGIQRDWVSNNVAKQYNLNGSYGFQILRFGSFIGHNGSLPGYNSFVLYDKNTSTSIVIVVNMQQNINKIPPADNIAQFLIYTLEGSAP